MNFVQYKGKKYKVDKYKRLTLSGLEIENLSQIEGINKIEGVKTLSLQHNNMKNISNLEDFTDLEVLSLYNNHIKQIEGLEGLSHLRTLNLKNNQIKKIKNLNKLQNIRELNLENNCISEIEGLEGITELEILNLSKNKISKIEGLSTLEKLEVLYLSHNRIKRIGGLENLKNLRRLYLHQNQIAELEGLYNQEKLFWLKLGNNKFSQETKAEFELEDGIFQSQEVVKHCRKKREEEKFNEESEKGKDASEDDKGATIEQFNKKFQNLKNVWKRFTEQDTYLTSQKKAKFLRKLRKISQFPWYYRIRYYRTLKKIKKKKKDFKNQLRKFNKKFIEKRLEEYSEFFEGKKFGIKYPLDPDQRLAVIKDDKHNLVVAGAGSGKTSVLTTRIAYLVYRKDNVPKDKILALAFTKVAAKEMEERLSKKFGIDIDISTFHALGRNIIIEETHSQPEIILKRQKLKALKRIFQSLLKEETFQELYVDYLLYHSDEEIEEPNFEDKELYYNYMRNKKYTTLNDIQVKSIAERNIGNFLFRNQIQFEYEPRINWIKREHADEDVKKSQKAGDSKKENESPQKEYHPDFYLPDYDIYIEHWGLNRKMEVPDWFTISSQEYQENRNWKLQQFETYQKTLIETWEYERLEANLIQNLKTKLQKLDQEIKFKPLGYTELVEYVSEFDVRKKDHFDLIMSFIEIAKSNYLMEDDVAERLKSKSYSPKQISFGRIALEVYKKYQKFLRAEDKIDFNDMINLAVELIQRNPDKYLNQYDHILIDEFQDISYQRMQLINCFVNEKSKTKLFCVGDDWQSIYQFTGSDVKFFVNFKKYFPHPEITHLKRNYRSAPNIVKMSNQLISHNKNQIEKEVHSEANLKQKRFHLFMFSKGLATRDTIPPPLVFKLIKGLMENGAHPGEIMVISRFNHNLKDIEVYCGANDIPVEEQGPNGLISGVRFYSAHKSKGSESKYVILTDLTSGTYGFPCEIQDSSVFEVVRRLESKSFVDEERRLFYVALTRSKQYLFLLSIQHNESMFLEEIQDFTLRSPMNSENSWEKIIDYYIPILMNGQNPDAKEHIFCEKCGNILLQTQGKYGIELKCLNYPICHYRFPLPETEDKTCPECGRKLVKRKGKYGEFLSCTGYPDCNYTADIKGKNTIICPKCDRQLIVRSGKYGKFIGCKGYPKCRYTFNLKKGKRSEIKCPKCGQPLVGSEKYGEYLRCQNSECSYSFGNK